MKERNEHKEMRELTFDSMITSEGSTAPVPRGDSDWAGFIWEKGTLSFIYLS